MLTGAFYALAGTGRSRLRCPRPLFYVPGASAFSTLSYTLELYAAHISSSFR